MVIGITDRDRARAACQALADERDQLDPTGLAWAVKDLELDDALAVLFALGPDPEHQIEAPWTGEPPAQRGPAD